MKNQYLKVLFLSVGLSLIASSGHTAVLQTSKKSTAVHSSAVEKVSPMTKALNQQQKSLINSPDLSSNTKIFTSIQTKPSQNFFAEQHQRFSRFVQSIFPSHNS